MAEPYPKELLNVIPAGSMTKMRSIIEATEKLSVELATNTSVFRIVEEHVLSI
jgi:hypothetical protein